ncbi:hypothetical protein BDY24DRAFT_373868 [Mrakia frigida]|uniref:uncharacterized protein n=1 Tax=Mrakia frigida TaxID=29902 RepID=UPI003FCC0878
MVSATSGRGSPSSLNPSALTSVPSTFPTKTTSQSLPSSLHSPTSASSPSAPSSIGRILQPSFSSQTHPKSRRRSNSSSSATQPPSPSPPSLTHPSPSAQVTFTTFSSAPPPLLSYRLSKLWDFGSFRSRGNRIESRAMLRRERGCCRVLGSS